MNENEIRLRKLMEIHGLTVQDVAKLTQRTESTVRTWLAPSQLRPVPIKLLELLDYKIRYGPLP